MNAGRAIVSGEQHAVGCVSRDRLHRVDRGRRQIIKNGYRAMSVVAKDQSLIAGDYIGSIAKHRALRYLIMAEGIVDSLCRVVRIDCRFSNRLRVTGVVVRIGQELDCRGRCVGVVEPGIGRVYDGDTIGTAIVFCNWPEFGS